MGGTLANRGGHNILEPAFARRPIIIGPHMENFPDIAEEFLSAGAVEPIARANELGMAVNRLLRDPARREALGQRALELAKARRGVASYVTAEVLEAHANGAPRVPHTLAEWLLLWPLSRAWRLGVDWKRKRQLASRRRLSTPVISIGGLAMGGVGKTPFALWLAARLKADRPAAILTRGYRRRSPEPLTIVEAGETCPVELTGDEAQLMVRAAVAHVGIGADRVEAGLAIEARLRPGVFLLDDGFQHWRLDRDVDIVLIDALDPFAGEHVFPLGRLREPCEALARAHVVVVTRAERGFRYDGIDRRIRAFNPTALICHARAVPVRWRTYDGSEEWAPDRLPFTRAAAFCGLGNPRSFWTTLEALGLRPRFSWAFGDHAWYRPAQIKRLVAQARLAGARALLTTAKDRMNLGEDLLPLFGAMPLCWLEIGMEVDEAGELDAILKQRIAR